MTPEMEKKAKELLEFCYKGGMPLANVCVVAGRDKMHVYVQEPAEVWPSFVPEATIWCGTPVEWHWDVGPAIAFDAAAP